MASSVDCNTVGCPQGLLNYEPSLAGNVIILALFAVLIPVTFVLGIKYKSSLFSTTLITGLALEVMGYTGRVLLRGNRNDRNLFALSLVGTILGPTAIAAAIFFTLPRVVALYGEEYQPWRPKWYNSLFAATTVICFLLEIAGAVLATVEDELSMIDTGIRVLVAGLAIQISILAIFIGLGIAFALAVRTRRAPLDPSNASVYESRQFKNFLWALGASTILLLLRTMFRIVPISEGLRSPTSQNETLFLILDGAAVAIACLLLVVFFPGRAFGSLWVETSPRRMSQKPLRHNRPAPMHFTHSQYAPTYGSPSHVSPSHISPSHISPAHTSPSGYSPSFNRVSMKSTATGSPRGVYAPQPNQQRRLVDNEALW